MDYHSPAQPTQCVSVPVRPQSSQAIWANLGLQINRQQGGGDQQEHQVMNISTIQDRIESAIGRIKSYHSWQREAFCQFWAPVTVAGQTILKTWDQPYAGKCLKEPKFRLYREMSSAHTYSTDIGKEDELGPPGRVFLQGSPDFSPNVRYYSTKEFPLRKNAVSNGVKEYCALPVFESTGGSLVCVGVLEFFSSYGSDVGTIFMLVLEALQAVGLISSDMYFHRCRDICTDQNAARAESKKLLDVLCKKYSLPMARTWVPCTCKCPEDPFRVRTKNSVSEVKRLFVVKDDGSWDASDEVGSFYYHCTSLEEWQGLVGKAFASGKSCFCKDITQFSKIDYPFVHYARHCKLTSCFAIFLHGIDPRFDICILELFLPSGGVYSGDPQALFQSLLATMAPHLHNFKVAAGGREEQGEKLIHEVHLFCSDNVDYFQISHSGGTLDEIEAPENESDQSEIDLSKEVENINASHIGGEERQVRATDSKKEGRIELEGKQEDVGDGITYELVKLHFGKKLVDAATSFQVSRSTFKRKLRMLGINRWPSRKRKYLRSVEEELTGDYPTGPSKSNAVPEKGRSATDAAVQDKNTMIIKATYGDHIIKFPLSFSSEIEDLKREIEKRLKLQSYRIEYKDEDDDWILMVCNDDLRYIMHNVLGKASIQLLLTEN